MRLSIEGAVLASLCLADALFTVWLVAAGRAVEANPILRFYLQDGGLVAFLGAKLLLSLGPIFVLERTRVRRPRFIRSLLRAGIALYVLSYGVGVWRANAHPPAGVPAVQGVRRDTVRGWG